MVTQPTNIDAASLYGKIEAVLPKLDETKPTHGLIADICFALRFLLREREAIARQSPTAIGLKKPKRDRAQYMRQYRKRTAHLTAK